MASRTVLPVWFTTEALELEILNRKNPGRPCLLAATSGHIDVTASAWTVEVSDSDFGKVCVANMVLWKQIARECNYEFAQKPCHAEFQIQNKQGEEGELEEGGGGGGGGEGGSRTKRRQQQNKKQKGNEAAEGVGEGEGGSKRRDGSSCISIPVLRLLNDMMKSATHPEVFSWALFDLTHNHNVSKKNTHSSKRGRTEGRPGEAIGGYLRNHMGEGPGFAMPDNYARTFTRFGNSCMIPLWHATIEASTKHHRPAMLVQVTLPPPGGPLLDLNLTDFVEPVQVWLPTTLDKPGEQCLIAAPARFHARTIRQPATPSSKTQVKAARREAIHSMDHPTKVCLYVCPIHVTEGGGGGERREVGRE